MGKPAFTVESIQSLFKLDEQKCIPGVIITKDMAQVRDYFTGAQHLIDGLLIGVCCKGETRVKVNFTEYIGREGTVLVLLPHTLIEPIRVTDDFETFSIVISLDFIASYPEISDFITNSKVRSNPQLKTSGKQFELLKEFLTFLKNYYYYTEASSKEEVLKHLVFAMIKAITGMYDTLTITKGKGKSRREKIVDDFYYHLSRHYKRERSVSYYADLLCLSPKYLTTVIREHTGKSILEWINDAVILQAKTLLTSTDLSIKEIATELNFTDASLFCRFFKRNAEMTASDFRSRK
ncbi:MAG: AraC family transcriptional regulator [Flavobacteriaceae bacterium]|nr:AraC family transcriptional regulator [Flavobacteriaceae bacterium]